jgi:hypothetical protein
MCSFPIELHRIKAPVDTDTLNASIPGEGSHLHHRHLIIKAYLTAKKKLKE